MAAVIYTKGCNFRCPFCHNRQLVLGQDPALITREKALEQLAARRGFIDGVVITGGEPTVHGGLGGLLAAVRQMGFAVKLDTNGYRPDRLRRILNDNLLDFVAMDIKTSLPKYHLAAGVEVDTDLIAESVELIKNSGIEYEFRTTCVPSLVDSGDIEAISRLVGKAGQYTLQQFQPVDTLKQDYNRIDPYPKETLLEFLEIASWNVASCRIIGVQ